MLNLQHASWQLDPPVAVRADAAEDVVGVEVAASANEPPPPGFESAARREHQNEAATLRKLQTEVRMHLLQLA